MQRVLSPDRMAALVGRFPRDPAYRGLCRVLQELIGDGRIPLGTRLPSERSAMRALGVSRNTVTRAYAELLDAGFATVRQGAGTFAAVPLERRRAHDHALHAQREAPAVDGAIDLTCAASPATPGVAAAYARALEALPAYLGSDGYLPSGLPALQAQLAAGFAQRGLPTRPEQIVVTAGALAALAVVVRALSHPGARVMLETPVYSNAIEALRLGGAQLVGAPLGEDGWDLDGLEATLQQTAPQLAYLIPDFQNPTGRLMGDAERARCAAALRAARTVPIVDEALQAIALSPQAMPAPFARHAPEAITLGSVSKLFWGGLRVGWIRAPQALVPRLIKARVQFDLGGSLFDQLVVSELLQDPSIAALRRSQLRERRDALAAALRERLPEWRFRLPEGGLSLWLQLPYGSATQLAAQLEPRGVHLAPGPVFSVEGGADQWLRLPYARPEAELRQAVDRIAEAWARQPPEAARGRARRLLIA